jgi:hypothetical protein
MNEKGIGVSLPDSPLEAESVAMPIFPQLRQLPVNQFLGKSQFFGKATVPPRHRATLKPPFPPAACAIFSHQAIHRDTVTSLRPLTVSRAPV